MNDAEYLKELGAALKTAVQKFHGELQAVRGSRPSIELLENIKVNYYNDWLAINQLGTLHIVPPREIQISVWDKNAIGPIMKAVDAANAGFTTSSDGNVVRATLSPLGAERREELLKLTKKIAEGARIQVRSQRDEIIKKLKTAESEKKLGEDEVFKAKERIQKLVDAANQEIETAVQNKSKELC